MRASRVTAALPLLSLLLISAGPADDGRFHAGGYSFSDELGGFRILDVKGSGTKADPLEITEELHSADPVMLSTTLRCWSGEEESPTPGGSKDLAGLRWSVFGNLVKLTFAPSVTYLDAGVWSESPP